MVSSFGRLSSSCSSVKPQATAAWVITGSILWLIRRHLKPLPLNGFSGNQWLLYFSHNNLFKVTLKMSRASLFTLPLDRSNFVIKSTALETSLRILTASKKFQYGIFSPLCKMAAAFSIWLTVAEYFLANRVEITAVSIVLVVERNIACP